MIRSLTKYLELIKFSHSVFALPFALISVFLAYRKFQIDALSQDGVMMIIWIIVAMVSARSGAMGFNRLVDRKWDAKNPRTAKRPSVSGDINVSNISVMIGTSFLILIYAAWRLNPLALSLSPVAIFLICFYSYGKRFTSLSHILLGIAIGAAPIAAWIGVTGEISITSLVIGASVLIWIAGFDILYALQDYEFDKKEGLHSIPVKFGVEKSLLIAKTLHIGTVSLWVYLAFIEDLKYIFYAGVLLGTIFLIAEHRMVNKDDISKVNVAFFNMNAYISIILLMATTLDLILF